MTTRDDIIAHAAACRAALDAEQARPQWQGGDLSGADLRGADLSGANLRDAYLGGAYLSDADLSGAEIAEGTVTASTYGSDGGYRWHALITASGVVVLQYGCSRAALTEWQTRGPEYGARHSHDEAHWAFGPAVAIAAAEALLTT